MRSIKLKTNNKDDSEKYTINKAIGFLFLKEESLSVTLNSYVD